MVDKEICPGTTTSLDAGCGFDTYLWSFNNFTTPSITDVPVGEYWVDLTKNGCTYRQYVSVKAVDLPEIISIEITGSTVTVNVTGGNAPYQYSLDSPNNYQISNIFTNVKGGDHRVYVISKDDCNPVFEDFSVIEVYNAITPNGDGINDLLNLSGLLKKDNPMLQIFDRYGNSMFKGDKNNNFSWDGKSTGKSVATGSYWYVLQWQEPGSQTISKSSGWILVKSRE